MIAPNKVIPLKGTTIGTAKFILDHGPEDIDVVSLYKKVEGKFESIDQFLLTLDTLFVLGKISVDFNTRIIKYAD